MSRYEELKRAKGDRDSFFYEWAQLCRDFPNKFIDGYKKWIGSELVWLGDLNSDDFLCDYDPGGDKAVLLSGTHVWGFKLSTRIDVGQYVTYTARCCFSLKDGKISMWVFERENIEGRVNMVVDDVSSFERGFELVYNNLLRYLNQRPDSEDGAATDMGFNLSPRTVP